MNRTKVNFWLDILLTAVFVITAITSIALFFGLGSRDIRFVHRYAGISLVVIMSAHLLLHLKWMYSMIKSGFKK